MSLMSAERMEQWIPPEQLLHRYEITLLGVLVGGAFVVTLGTLGYWLGSVGRSPWILVLAIGGTLVCIGAYGFVWFLRNGPRLLTEASPNELV
jgi:uncharacterized membrane protein